VGVAAGADAPAMSTMLGGSSIVFWRGYVCASLLVGPTSYYDTRPQVVGPSLVPSCRGKIRCKVSRGIRRLR
jgi:hypothetical protein